MASCGSGSGSICASDTRRSRSPARAIAGAWRLHRTSTSEPPRARLTRRRGVHPAGARGSWTRRTDGALGAAAICAANRSRDNCGPSPAGEHQTALVRVLPAFTRPIGQMGDTYGSGLLEWADRFTARWRANAVRFRWWVTPFVPARTLRLGAVVAGRARLGDRARERQPGCHSEWLRGQSGSAGTNSGMPVDQTLLARRAPLHPHAHSPGMAAGLLRGRRRGYV